MSLLGPRHEVRLAGEDRRHEPGDVGREILQVRREEHEYIAARHLGPRPERVRDAALGAVRDDAEERVPRAEVPEDLGGPVEAAVVHDDELAGVGERQERVARLADQLGKVFGFVFRGNEHAHLGRDGPGGEAHRRLRMRAGRTPSWSRYFATVRRAILTPRWANSSTIC